ncbi:DNA-directed RNA polymerase subunit A'' [Salinilacihabitans rarus]|uniref:DNA-directed RNA polymerase subunit A'' n=1 Tax=Salinilacihabitans rarus TaxID=2961596 RepID=UPI0020C8CD1C|nr:DNA-directed RNA polymerase subunit A'' [Salinilacihabitans rarus]
MTELEYDVGEDVIAVVEDTDLPRRLKDRVYETIEARDGVTTEQADEIATAVENRYLDTRVDPLDPVGTVSAQSIGEPGTQLTMNTFHYAGVAEIDVTQGLPRLIELVDARKTPDTPMMTVHLEDEFATEREKAHEVVWKIEATKILALGDVSTNVADMRVQISLNRDTLEERMITPEEVAEIIEDHLGVEAIQRETTVEFGPEEPSYRDLLQLVEELRDITFKGIEDISRVVIRREEREAQGASDGDDGEEFVLYTEGSAFGDVLEIDGVDATRTTTNNIHEIYRNLGVEAAREAIIEETNNTLAEQGLDDVNVRHLMLVADIMTNRGEIESIGRHGISGSKDSVLARAAFEVTVNHLLNAAIHGEVDDLNGVTENVIVGKPIKLGTGDVDLRMGSTSPKAD